MIKNFVLFKNPYLRYRKEEFGGIVKIRLKTFLLDTEQYDFIMNIDKIFLYNELNQYEKKIVKNLIKNKILLKVELKKAVEMGFKQKEQIRIN